MLPSQNTLEFVFPCGSVSLLDVIQGECPQRTWSLGRDTRGHLDKGV